MSRPIASHPPWTTPAIATGMAMAGTAAAVPEPVPRTKAFGTVARVLEDIVLVVVAVFLFPLIILLVGSPIALLVKGILAGVPRFL